MAKHIEDIIIQFDSCSSLLKSLALSFRNQDFKGGGVAPGIPSWVGQLVNGIPRGLRQRFYAWSGWIDALVPKDLEQLETNAVAKWAVDLYPNRPYNGVMIGSSNGGAVHLAAALGMPWLPQTYLVAVRRMLHPDCIHKDIEWGKKVIGPVLDRLTDLHAAQMHDPVQDRLMVSKMGYFRLKMVGLPKAFNSFLDQHTSEVKPIITVECRYQWPSLTLSDRHTFQLGGFGAITPYEYLQGSKRTTTFLKKVGAKRNLWETFHPDGERAEAEWGFYDEILEDIYAAAKRTQAPLYRLMFDHPEGLSAFACDLYRWWYKKRLGLDSKRMTIENFALVCPYRALRAGALPFWLAFNTQNSAELMEEYLDRHDDIEELYLMLMSNGVKEGIGLTTIDRWKNILKRAKHKGCFVGVDQKEYPLDFATFMRYHIELQEYLPDAINPLQPLSIDELLEFIKAHPGEYPLRFQRAEVLPSPSSSAGTAA